MFLKVVIVVVALLAAWKGWQHYRQPSPSEIHSLSKALGNALCNAELLDAAEALNTEIKIKAQALASDKTKTSTMSEGIKAGLEFGQMINQITAATNPHIRLLADPLFNSAGWTPNKVYKVLAGLKGEAKPIIDEGSAQSDATCPDVKNKEIRRSSASWILRAYLTSAGPGQP